MWVPGIQPVVSIGRERFEVQIYLAYRCGVGMLPNGTAIRVMGRSILLSVPTRIEAGRVIDVHVVDFSRGEQERHHAGGRVGLVEVEHHLLEKLSLLLLRTFASRILDDRSELVVLLASLLSLIAIGWELTETDARL